jgi:hypothetical protein
MRKLSKFYQSERERGVLLSAVMHLVFLLSILVGIPDMLAPPPPEPTTITVDILPISELTNIKPMDSRKPEPTTEPEEKKAPPTKSEEQAPPPPKAAEPPPAEEEKIEPAPDPLLEQKKLEELRKLEEEKKAKAEKEKKEKEKKEKEKAEKEKKEKEKKDKEFAALIDTLAKEKKKQQDADKKKTDKDQSDQDDKKDKASKNNSQKYDDSMPMSISEKDAIMSQFAKYWSMPAGAKNADNLIVTLNVELRQDGVVLKVELAKSNEARYNSDSFFRAAADSAIRAVRLASPIQNLPQEKYQTWRYMELSFDPRQMLY